MPSSGALHVGGRRAREREERKERERERFEDEDVPLLALRREEGPRAKEGRWPPEAGGGEETDPPFAPLGEMQTWFQLSESHFGLLTCRVARE